MVESIITALRAQLIAYPALYYAHDSGYEDEDVEELVQGNKFPFFNITVEGWSTGPTNNVNVAHLERLNVTLLIQFAVRCLKRKQAARGDSGNVGVYEFAEEIQNAIRSDPKLGGAVHGYLPGSSVDIDVVAVGSQGDRFFIGAGEMRLKLYKDIGRL
jgi:hypothetical protein